MVHFFSCIILQSGTQTSLEDIPPLDKIPTNEFIEKFLEDDNHPALSTETTLTEMSKSRKSTKAKIEPLPDLSDDDLETVLDIKGMSQRMYHHVY